MKKQIYFLSAVALATLNFELRTLNCSAQNINTIAGTTQGLSGDGGPAISAQLDNPTRVAVDASGNVYIADYWNQRIRKVNTSGVISTFAGTGTCGLSGDGASATSAQLCSPIGVEVDASGNVYIADMSNHRIRKVNTSGVISTFAGTTGGLSGDGGLAVSAQLNQPNGVAVDASGNVYIADAGNHRIRMVNTSGVISTFAGTGTCGLSGDGASAISAQLCVPSGIAVDASGNVYIADYGNHRIRKINTSGVISTIAGTTQGLSGDGASATSAQLKYPYGVAVDASCNVYIADYGNHRTRKVDVGSCAAVPIQLLYFTAIAENNSRVRCEWATASEFNNSHFDVERSKDGVNFEKFGKVDGAPGGNSSITLYYVYYDYEPYNGVSYYRLKQVDFNGAFTYSEIRAVYIGTIDIISIFPNPASDYIEYLLGSSDSVAITVTLYDAIGREVYNKEETIEKGVTTKKISTANLSNGNYLLRITNGNKEKIQKQFVIK